MLIQEPLARYNLACITEVYTLDLRQYLCSRSNMRDKNRRVGRRQTEESKLKISRANKGKRLGYAPWNKGKKLHYIPGKREHSVQTLEKMNEAAKRRWSTDLAAAVTIAPEAAPSSTRIIVFIFSSNDCFNSPFL